MDELLWSQCEEPQALLGAVPVDPSPRKRRLLIAACVDVAKSELPLRIRHLGKLLMELADATGKKRDSIHSRMLLALRRARASPSLQPGSEYEEWVTAIRNAMVDDDLISPAPPLVAGQSYVYIEWSTNGPYVRDAAQCQVIRDLYANPFLPAPRVASEVCEAHDELVLDLARGIYQDHAFELMPALGDALEDAGCDDAALLEHCRTYPFHARGCWALDAILEHA